MLGIFQMNFKVLQFTIWEKLPSSTHINFNIFCHLKIITQSNGLFGERKIYFSADAIRSSEKVYEGLKGTKIIKDISELNYVGRKDRANWCHCKDKAGMNGCQLVSFGISSEGKAWPESPCRAVVWHLCQFSWYGQSTQCPPCQNWEGGLDHPETFYPLSPYSFFCPLR